MDTLIKKIIVPVDFSVSSERAARFAFSLAHHLRAHVYLIHVLNGEPAGRASHLVRCRDASTSMSGFVARIGRGRALTSEIRTGAVAEEIASAVRAYGGDLVVMATHGRTGLPHLLMGSVAEEVIRVAACPVLVMKDSGKVRVHARHSETLGEQVAEVA